MDAGLGAVEVVVDLVGDERRERGEQLRDGDEGVAEGGEGGGVTVPEAPARAPHLPVREVVDERRDGLAAARGVVVVQPVADDGDGVIEPGGDPLVEVVGRRCPLVRTDVVDVRVLVRQPAAAFARRRQRRAAAGHQRRQVSGGPGSPGGVTQETCSMMF